MTIVMANDTGAFSLKEAVRTHLESRGKDVLDLGTLTPEQEMTYVEAGKAGAKAIQEGKADRGILFCGSGAGVMMVSNKFKGIHSVVSESPFTTAQARIINDVNVLCIGASVIDKKTALEMADLFLDTEFAAGADDSKKQRLGRFIDEIKVIEDVSFK